MNRKLFYQTVGFLGLGFGLILIARDCSDHLGSRARARPTPEQTFEIGKAAGAAWAQSPLFDKNTAEDNAFMRGFFAGMNSVLEHIEFQTNKPHMVLEITNVLADLDRLQKSNAFLRQQLKPEK